MQSPATKVLVVDDESALAELMRYHLHREGHEVMVAANGWEAVALAKQHAPDVMLLDLMLPDLDGFAVGEILRGDPATARIPIIIVSAWTSPDSRKLGSDLGVVDYVTKPFSPHDLVERVNRLTSHRAV